MQNPSKYLDFFPKKVGRWWNKNEEIDLIAMDETNICFIECKWRNSVDKEQVLYQLIKKSKFVKHNLKESFLVITKDNYLANKTTLLCNK